MTERASKPRVMVCVTGQKSCERLIRYGAFLSQSLNAGLDVVHVAKPGASLMGAGTKEAEAFEFLYGVAADNGASLTILRSKRVLDTLVTYAEDNHAIALVTGSPAPGTGQAFVSELRDRLVTADVHMLPYEE